MLDMNNLSPRQMADFDDEQRCGDCLRRGDECACPSVRDDSAEDGE